MNNQLHNLLHDLLDSDTIVKMLNILEAEYPKWNAPIVTFISQTKGKSADNKPFRVLIATLLSLRTKDQTTGPAALRLFDKAETPKNMLKLSQKTIEKLIYPVGFYHIKAGRILEICRILVQDHNSIVPNTIDELVKFPGVGRKTANLVVSLGYGIPAMCVDIHVHRISNRWGYIQTKTPDKSEIALREKLPIEWWNHYNDILVAFGQTICKSVSPFCSKCPVEEYCQKTGVEKHR